MGRFDEMMKRARNIAADVEEAAIADFEKVIARGEEIHKVRERATAAHLTKLDSTHAALSHFGASIDEYANGAPPLDDGEKSGDVSDRKAWEPPKS